MYVYMKQSAMSENMHHCKR